MTAPDIDVAGADGPAEKRKDAVASLAGQITKLSTGDRAALRRLFLTRSAAADGVVIGLMHRAGLPEATWHDDASFARWRLLAHVAATLSGTANEAPHHPAGSLGRSLHAVGYSEHRLMRLTSVKGAALPDQIVRAARTLAAGGQRAVRLHTVFDLSRDAGALAERARLRIARDYYSAEYASRKDAP